jgi:sulfonate transport system permease protein
MRPPLAWRSIVLRFVLPAVLVAVWWTSTGSGWIKPYQLASPGAVVNELAALAASGTLQADLWASASRVAVGFAIALVLALMLGSLAGSSRRARLAIDPTLQAIRAVPSLAWVPLILLWFGIGESAKIVLVAIGAFFPIYVSLLAGIQGVDRKLIEVADVLQVGRRKLIAEVLVPATLPQLLTGARLGLTQAWLFLVAAELLAASRGLGFLLSDGQQVSRTDEVLVAILLFALCGKLTDMGVRAIERRWTGWADTVPA